ncbi:hypothetical protein F9K79_10595 [Ochrobactrum sp. Kaboul]|nr:hypothetical protein F9K79_10595 [Ochrobactrum sp. Kaboul]
MTSIPNTVVPEQRARFAVIQDKRGQWVVFDRLGLTGGLFTDRETALRFAKRACRTASDTVCLSSGPVASDAIFGKKSTLLRLVQ